MPCPANSVARCQAVAHAPGFSAGWEAPARKSAPATIPWLGVCVQTVTEQGGRAHPAGSVPAVTAPSPWSPAGTASCSKTSPPPTHCPDNIPLPCAAGARAQGSFCVSPLPTLDAPGTVRGPGAGWKQQLCHELAVESVNKSFPSTPGRASFLFFVICLSAGGAHVWLAGCGTHRSACVCELAACLHHVWTSLSPRWLGCAQHQPHKPFTALALLTQ